MRKVMLVATVSLSTVLTVSTHAMPIAPVSSQAISASDLIEVKGGHGHGHGCGKRSWPSPLWLEPWSEGGMERPSRLRRVTGRSLC